jgi:putative ABC transport system permease protein
VLLGIPAGYEVAKVFAGQINVWFTKFTLSAVGILAGIVMGLGVPVLAAIVPVYLGTRVTILDALTDLGISARYGSGPLARLIKRLPVPMVVRQALANVSQKKGRLALTTLTLMLAAGGFMGVTAVFLDLDKVVNDMFETYNYELVITPERPQDHEPIARLVGSMDGVDRVDPSYSWDAYVPLTSQPGTEYTHLWVIGFDTSTDSMKLHLSEGTAWQDDPARAGIVLTTPRAEELGKQAGDPITLTYEGRTLETQVIGIDTNPEEDAYMAWQPLYQLIHPTSEPTPGELWVRLNDRSVSAGDVDKVIGSIREELLRNGLSAGFFNQVGQEEEISALILAMSLIFNIASVVMALVAGIGLLTMLSISVFERQREIGVKRSVGASSGAVAAQFLIEGLVVGVIGWLVAIPISYVLSQGFQEVIPWEAFEFSYPPEIILVGLIGTLALAALASLWPALTAARKRVSDILRYQ